MKTNTSTYTEIASTLSEAINSLVDNYQGSSLTDIFLLIDRDSGELSVYDDEENLLSQRIIKSWLSIDNDEAIALQLRELVEKFDMDNKFDALDTFKPFSVNLADESFIVQEELLLIEDDATIRLDNDFLERMDKEFDEFLDNLLKQ